MENSEEFKIEENRFQNTNNDTIFLETSYMDNKLENVGGNQFAGFNKINSSYFGNESRPSIFEINYNEDIENSQREENMDLIYENHFRVSSDNNKIKQSIMSEQQQLLEPRNIVTIGNSSEDVIETNSNSFRQLKDSSNMNKNSTSLFQDKVSNHYVVIEKEDVKDIISYHKVYEILFINENEEKRIKCFRRYDNFDKLNTKLRKKYPYLVIPKLTPKHPIAKLLPVEEEFYDNRLRQLNFYMNYLYTHQILGKTKEFIKFTSEAEFDETFFLSEDQTFVFPQSLKISEKITNKLYSVLTNIFFQQEELRKISDEEICIKRMENHYKGLLDKYKEIKMNVSNYIKTLKSNADGFKNLGNTCFYLKDTLENAPNSRKSFKVFNEIYSFIAEVNKSSYDRPAIGLENKFEVI
jgi:hypothetical protein